MLNIVYYQNKMEKLEIPKKSETQLLKRIEKTYGPECKIFYGDLSLSSR